MAKEKVTQSKRIIEKYTMVALKTKTIELKEEIPTIKLEDIYNFFETVVMDGKQLKNTNDAVYYILNISAEDMKDFLSENK